MPLMNYLFELSQSHLSLAKEEVLALLGEKELFFQHNLLVAATQQKEVIKRLAYTKKAYQFLFSCKRAAMLEIIQSYNWQKVYGTSFAVRIIHYSEARIGYSEKDLGSLIWKHLKTPKVRLEHSDTIIHFFVFEEDIWCGKLVYENQETFQTRKPHQRPGHMPISLDPRLARAMVNLSSIPKGKLLFDPFCGVGGILLEAGLIGLPLLGADISAKAILHAEKNFRHYSLTNYKLLFKDFRDLNGSYPFVVTDVPYGKSTKVSMNKLSELYEEFFKSLKRWKCKKAVVGFPHFIDIEPLIRKHKLQVKHLFTIYVHKSLTRKIFVFEL